MTVLSPIRATRNGSKQDCRLQNDEICLQIGHTLMMIQIAEKRINDALLVVSAAENVTMEELEKMDDARRSGSLRKALEHLSKRVVFPSSLQSFVEDLIKRRNDLVHRFSAICMSMRKLKKDTKWPPTSCPI
jgi:hypothetical protein